MTREAPMYCGNFSPQRRQPFTKSPLAAQSVVLVGRGHSLSFFIHRAENSRSGQTMIFFFMSLKGNGARSATTTISHTMLPAAALTAPSEKARHTFTR
jgi:hypothetical protein